MAFQVGQACYPTEVAAAQAAASSQLGAVVEHGSAAYVVDASGVTASSITYVLQPVGGGTAITIAAPYTPVPCQMLDWSDGLVLGWAVGGVWIAVTALLFIARAIKGEPDGNNA